MAIEGGGKAFDIEGRMRYLPETLLKDVGDKIIPSQSGIILPGFPKGLCWEDECHGHGIGKAIDRFGDQLTHISQWNELHEYLELKGFDEERMSFHKKAIFGVLNMNSEIIGATWPYLTMGDQNIWSQMGFVNQKTHGILVGRDQSSVEFENNRKSGYKVFRARLQRKYG